MAPSKDKGNLLAWHKALTPLRVDIIGDFAGKELFAIHGDALLVHCISEAQINHQDGFQILHAIHAVEKFLANLRARGCRFHIIWFDSHEKLCVPTDCSEAAAGFHRLTRTILIKHLQRHGPGKDIVFEFPKFESVEFQYYTAENSIRFFLCLDGLSFDSRLTPFASWHLAVIQNLGARGYSVALINSFEFQSSRVFAFMLPASLGSDKARLAEPTPFYSKEITQITTLELKAGVFGTCWSPWDNGTPLSARDTVSLTGVCNVLLNDSSDAMKSCAAAYLLHLSELKQCSLSDRPCAVALLDSAQQKDFDAFFSSLADICIAAIRTLPGQEKWDIFDLFDTRMTRQIFMNLSKFSITSAHSQETGKFAKRVRVLTGVDISGYLPTIYSSDLPKLTAPQSLSNNVTKSVMPFKHPVLDEYLEPVRVIAIDSSKSQDFSKIFRELVHWRNAKKTLDPKKPLPSIGFFAHKRNQKLMADTIAYSASLTNAAGKIITPETIVAGLKIGATVGKKRTYVPRGGSSKPAQLDLRPKKKNDSGKSGKDSAREAVQRIQKGKLDSKAKDVLGFWDKRCREIQDEKSVDSRIAKATSYFNDLSKDTSDLIGAEVLLYVCHNLVSAIQSEGQQRKGEFQLTLFAKLWSVMLEAGKLQHSAESLHVFKKLSSALKMPVTATESKNDALVGRKLPFSSNIADFQLPLPPLEFQLEHCGPFLERSFDPMPDARVPNFTPDAWQRKVLDAIDADKSLFVVAPTSAGKTFISFYAMKRVLQFNDDGVLVYVAPTKALVNQIAAEIQARFSKSYHHDGRSVWGIHTRDYRVNNATGCQVLVTVPHILQIMLLTPPNAENANSWSRRVKRIIFDEVHCIGQADDGVIWEQLLLLAPCPIIALSATVGNPVAFMQWLEASEKAKGHEMEMIIHSARYSDLRKFMYSPSKSGVAFKGLSPAEGIATPGLDEANVERQSFNFIHPIASITNRNRGTIDDVILEPRDCLTLWRCMVKYQNDDYPIDDKLSPEKVLPDMIKRSDVIKWGNTLKQTLQSWMEDVKSPFLLVQSELGQYLPSLVPGLPAEDTTSNDSDSELMVSLDNGKQQANQALASQVLPLLTDLHDRGALPAILFNYNRDACENTVIYVLSLLEKAEKEWKDSSPKWAKTLKDYAAWRKTKVEVKVNKSEGRKKSSKKGVQDDEELSKIDMIRDASVEASKWESFDPEAPLGQFSFANIKVVPDSELQRLMENLSYANVNPKICTALKRGIAVHHAGMNRHYRQTVEILFRKGYLRAVIATGTLALGLNMPCKTVVFFGDSVFLTSLNYHQASGRAGRRGFDLLGNVVFVGMPRSRALEIMSSSLPDLSGHFPLSTTLVLRLLGLLYQTNNSEFATKAIQSLLSLSRLYLGGPADQMAIRHHLRFSIEYLRRQRLLSEEGVPLNFSGLVGHLYFTENAVFAFHSLLKEGYFHEICQGVDRNPEAVLLKLVLVLAHLFCRIPLGIHSSFVNGHKSPSVIKLPSLPEEAATILQAHNQETLGIFRLYVSTFIEQHLAQTPDTKLPFTGCETTPQQGASSKKPSMVAQLPPTKLRSPFAALSGFTDEFTTIHELCATVRSGIFLEESAVPYIPIYPADTGGKPWNAYIYDFFKHGDLTALVRDNRIRRGDVWFHLKDFSLTLATIVTSLKGFIDAEEKTDDGSDSASEDRSKLFDEEMPMPNMVGKEPASQAVTPNTAATTSKKGSTLDSWEDDVSDGEDATSTRSTTPPLDEHPWQNDGSGNLLQVLRAFRLLHQEFEAKFRQVWS